MKSNEIRSKFLRFFEEKNHMVIPSSSLVPDNDPSLLLTSAGMVQFKDYFSGLRMPPNDCLVSIQKCLRTPDMDVVGDETHSTFFEMMGNFSFGLYDKCQAIDYAVECLTDVYDIPETKLFVTVHKTDFDSYDHWQKYIPRNRIFLGEDDSNWWGPAGAEGPTGPCTEIYYDTNKCDCDNSQCIPDECNRFVELWNLVFMQFYERHGVTANLPTFGVDTGMGLERLAMLLQDKETIYDTDLLRPAVDRTRAILNRYSEYSEVYTIVDHIRSAIFLLDDKVIPSNKREGYILRKLIRRATTLGRRLSDVKDLLVPVGEVLIDTYSEAYPSIWHNRYNIETCLMYEEDSAHKLMDRGEVLLDKMVSGHDGLSGADAFRLWDTYGMPIEITTELCLKVGKEIDLVGFHKNLEEQRERSRKVDKP